MPKRWALIIGLIGFCQPFLRSQNIPHFDFSKFSVFSIEKQIFRLLNNERESRGLLPLKTLPKLVALARDHCLDMARQNRLTHDSSDGKTYPDRLVEADLYFLESGENAAFSETYSSRLIHQSLLESPEHRENILNPNFDQVGIGVIYQRDKGFYITQDFLHSFPMKSEEEIKQRFKERLIEERERQGQSPLRFTPELDELAEDYTQRKDKGKELGQIPEKWGYGKIVIYRTPEIIKIENDIKQTARENHARAGIGVAFGRSAKNVGGEYILVLLLVNKDKAVNWSKESLRDQIFEKMNRIRQDKGRKKLTFNTSLSYEADLIASHLRINPRVQIALPPGMRSDQLVMYSTNDPFTLAASTAEKISSDHFRTVGIGILIDPNPDSAEKTYWIAIILD